MKPILKLYTILLLLFGLLYINFTVDDAFITFRYGKNLIEHGIWNWNPTSSNLVEAYTNPIFAGLSIIPSFFNFNIIFLFKILGIVYLYLTFKLLSNSVVSIDKWLCGAFIVTNMMIFPHAFSGLETIPFFLSAFYLMTLKDEELKGSFTSWMIFWAPLIRPEGALLSIYIIFQQIRIQRKPSTSALVAIALGIIYFLIRYYYFGFVLPNTYYAKTGEGFSTFILNLIADKTVIIGWIISMLFILMMKGRVLLPFMLFLGYALGNLTANLQMNYAYRYGWHMLMPAIFYAFWLAIRDRSDLNPRRTIFLFVLFLIAFNINFKHELIELLNYYPNAIKSHRELGLMLSKYTQSKPILAVGDAGLIPYYSDLVTIDYLGLANVEIAHAIKDNKMPLLQAPDIMIVYSNTETSCASNPALQFKGEIVLRKYTSAKDYVCVPGPRWGNEYYLNFLIRKDFKQFTSLVTDIGKIKSKSNGVTTSDEFRNILYFNGLR